MIRTMTAASRWANAVASAGTRAIAPPRTRSWTIVVGELGAAMRVEHRVDRVVVERAQEARAVDRQRTLLALARVSS